MLRKNTVSEVLIDTLNKLMCMPSLSGFRLAGGTALALQLGHRKSVDIDLFTGSELQKESIIEDVAAAFLIHRPEKQSRWGLRYTLNEIKVEIYGWGIPFVTNMIEEENIRMASVIDIATMKLEAIKERQEKKDFVDLFVILNKHTFSEIFEYYKIKYPYQDIRFVIDALLLVDNADASPDPIMLIDYDWIRIKKKILSATKSFIDNETKK